MRCLQILREVQLVKIVATASGESCTQPATSISNALCVRTIEATMARATPPLVSASKVSFVTFIYNILNLT